MKDSSVLLAWSFRLLFWIVLLTSAQVVLLVMPIAIVLLLGVPEKGSLLAHYIFACALACALVTIGGFPLVFLNVGKLTALKIATLYGSGERERRLSELENPYDALR